ncbi:MAG: histidinol-phosphatase HisJ family protein [Peptacetobacter hiranonis]|uniref:histidinol-phosphatase HisJ family protein n=1 Tax=Peptacetobacter hiranonis TaxID=89152 RepID=UPI0022DF4632|nr:histidinol-phosphatase HisJ family protein [Peptacetobacter hiranonis]MED9948267.1 histidinol-phosphatase HisJ family protein [Peptacetobacter hiranonis]
MFCDYHTHTVFSSDSMYPMEDCIKDAISLGIEEICFTDHVDYGIKDDWDDLRNNKATKKYFNVDYDKYFSDLETLREKYKNQITIKNGLEFGIQKYNIEKYNKLFEKYPLDFIILSVHQIDDKEFWNHSYQDGKTEKEYYEDYFNEIYYLVQNYSNYCVLGHLDMMKRYDEKDGYNPFVENKEIITKILKRVIADGKGIELNTSSIKYKLDDLMPSRDILKLYLELGGEVLTIGSDSHCKRDLKNSHIEELKQELRDIGFTKFCTFEKMKPTFHEL